MGEEEFPILEENIRTFGANSYHHLTEHIFCVKISS